MTNLITNIGITAVTASVAGIFYVALQIHDLKSLKTTSDKIKVNVKVISDYLTRSEPDFDHTNLQAYSPLRLTPAGKGFIKKLGFDKVFEEHQQDFFDFIDQDEPKQKYDVETAAFKSVMMLSDEDYMGFLKKFMYNNPGRNLRNTAPTLGVYIRDKYFAERPNITE